MVLLCTSHDQSFVSTTPLGPGNSGAFKARIKAQQGGVIFCGEIPAKSHGSPEADNYMEQQLVVVLKNTYERGV